MWSHTKPKFEKKESSIVFTIQNEKMFFVVDLVVLVILALCIFLGYKRGLTGCLIKVLSFFIAVIVALVLFKPASSLVISNTQLDENIQTSIVQVFEKDEDNNTDEENSSPIMKYISEEVKNATEERKNEIVNEAAKKLSTNIINVLCFISLFILTRIALIFVKALTDLITKLPILKQCDKIGGILYGLLHGLVVLFIGFALITFISTITNQYGLMELINESYIGRALCNNNILINLIF